MARPLRIEYPGAFYHIVQRGINRAAVFHADKDKQRFIGYLNNAWTTYRAIIHSYVLMDNHYHLILETPQANLSKIMHYLDASYAMYFNAQHKRCGPLYQGRYKAILVQADAYLHHLSRYIHLNPVRAKIVDDPGKYPWSSYYHFVRNTEKPEFLERDSILNMFSVRKKEAFALYREFVLSGIDNEKEIISQHTQRGLVLGENEFLETVIKKFIMKKDDKEIPAIRIFKRFIEPNIQDIRSLVKEKVDDPRLFKRIAIYLSRKYTQKSLKEIGLLYGNITDAGISRSYKKVETERRNSQRVDRLIKLIEATIEKSRIET